MTKGCEGALNTVLTLIAPIFENVPGDDGLVKLEIIKKVERWDDDTLRLFFG